MYASKRKKNTDCKLRTSSSSTSKLMISMAGNRSAPQNGYSTKTRIYHSLRPTVPLPPLSQPLSIYSFTLSLLNSPSTATSASLSTTNFLINATTGHKVTFSTFLEQVSSLSSSLKPLLNKSDVAFILSPPSLHIPVIYFSLLSLGITVSPANPLSTESEITYQLRLSRPVIIFATRETYRKLPPNAAPQVILIDSPYFQSMLKLETYGVIDHVVVNQTDPAAILYSSGTTGKVKGVVLTHRNLISVIAGMYHNKLADQEEEVVNHGVYNYVHPVSLLTLRLFHIFGFTMLIRGLSMGESLVLLENFDFFKMLEAVEMYKVTYVPVDPPLVEAMERSETDKYDLSSLQKLGCYGAPLDEEVSVRFRAKFTHVQIFKGYGMTETTGGATTTVCPEEARRYGSAGRLAGNMEAKIVDRESGEALPPGQLGELWLRGPAIMKGYAGDDAATAATLDSEGWIRTGDLCYFDSDGFLHVVDRLTEVTRYKVYQVPPAELEHLLQSIPEVADAAVIGYHDEEAGQIPVAYVVRKPGSSISATQIMDFIAKQVGPYIGIRRVAFLNSIPNSPAEKILWKEMIKHALSNTSSNL